MDTVFSSAKNILVISYGPVPTPEFQKIEGGGMRCWGLALGLRDNGHNVTVSIFEEFRQNIESHQGIHLHNWALNKDFKDYMNSFDAVIVSYSMGDLSMFVADNLLHHITLVLDCYVPIYIEISARDSEDKASELSGYMHEIGRFNHVLRRGDFFLCANEPQRHMYMGILGSLGVINPYSYRQHRVLLVPFGVENDRNSSKAFSSPYATKKDDFVLLWFGGLYPWFNFKPLIQAIKTLSADPHFKFYLVGGKNPYNNHPDFVSQYEFVRSEFQKMGLLDKTVFLVDWVDFDDRVRWFKNADLVVSINNPGEENIYSWRTRVMDYVWGELPMISNGGDPLSDELILNKAAVKTSLSPDDIATKVRSLMEDRRSISSLKHNLLQIKKHYYWDKVTSPLSDILTSDNNLPFVDVLSFMDEHHIRHSDTPKLLKQRVKKARSYIVRAKQKGIKRSAKFALGIAKSQAKEVVGPKRKKTKAFFISHPIDHSGAPLVLLDLIDDFNKAYTAKDINIVAPAVKKDLLNTLLAKRYKIHKMVDGIGGRFIQAGLQIKPNDFVLLNSTATYQNYKDYLYWMLESGRLKKCYWFIHEDNPKFCFKNKKETARVQRLVQAGKFIILVPSMQTASAYNRFFNTNTVKPVNLRVQIPKKYDVEPKESDFDKIKFFISGNPLDGRKGQLLFLSALQLFESQYKAREPKKYRSYSLDLVSIGNDYISEQIVAIGSSLLDERLKIHPVIPRDKALEVAAGCNVTVCCSLMESFGLYVAEGMLMGHPIIRNKSSGWQEQIKDGVNGLLVDRLSLDALTLAISKILSYKMTNKELVNMGKASQKIASDFSSADYYHQIMKD